MLQVVLQTLQTAVQALGQRASWAHVHVNEYLSWHSNLRLFVLAFGSPKSGGSAATMRLRANAHTRRHTRQTDRQTHTHACAPWAQPAFSEYRRTSPAPMAELDCRGRQDRLPASQGCARGRTSCRGCSTCGPALAPRLLLSLYLGAATESPQLPGAVAWALPLGFPAAAPGYGSIPAGPEILRRGEMPHGWRRPAARSCPAAALPLRSPSRPVPSPPCPAARIFRVEIGSAWGLGSTF